MRRALVLLAACGSSQPAPDAADPRGEIYLKVVSDDMTNKPVKGAQLIVSDPDGSPHEILTTDANGLATGHALPGGSVTKLPTAPEIQFWTVLDVSPGEHVVLGPEELPTFNPTGQSVEVAFPYPDAQAVEYELDTSCGRAPLANGSPATVPISGTCTTIQAFAIAHGSADIVATAWTDPQTFANGQTLTTQSTWQAVDQLALQVSNVPSGLQHIIFDYGVGVPVYGGATESAQLDAQPTMPIMTGDHTLTLTHAYGPQAIYAVELYASSSNIQQLVEKADPNATTAAVDAATQFLPPVTSLRFDPATMTLREGQPGAPPLTIVQTTISWATSTQNYAWNIFAPRAGDVTLPQLMSAPVPPASATGTIEIWTCATDGIASYADAHKHPFDSLQTCSGGLATPGTQWQLTTAGANFP